MSRLARFNRALEAVLSATLAGLVGLLVLVVLWQVGTRLTARANRAFGLNLPLDPAPWTEELASFTLVWIALLGAAYAARRGEHIGLDLIDRWLTPGARRATALCGRVAMLTFSGVLIAGGGLLVELTLALDQRTAALGWPMGAVYLALPLSGMAMASFALERTAAADGIPNP